ncbi:unnamed protein product [Adineta ricciae]|uniref:Uncharacterized protein n=1 Tax=Adineta ricciae TaxID=249248 RepID=A0A814C0Y8_ADIRI|nr:unnamed protein product [Adineta ricciae]CAF1020171.1 unnamed protein product [Adineta ricciae]
MSSEEVQLNEASDAVHQESNYSDEYDRTHGATESQRDPTMFPNTDQDNVVDMSAADTNTTVQEITKSLETTNISDHHPHPKSQEHTDHKHGKTVHHSPTRRKSSFTNQTHHNAPDHSDTQAKPVHHSPTRRKSITHDTHGTTANHSPTRRKSITQDTHGKPANHSPTRRNSITNQTHKDAPANNNPTRRKSITHDTHGATANHSPTRRKSITQDTHAKPANHSPTRRKSITHDTHAVRRKSNAHEHDKDQAHRSEKIEHGDIIIANADAPTETATK